MHFITVLEYYSGRFVFYSSIIKDQYSYSYSSKKHTFLLLTFSFFTYFDLKLLATNLKIYFSVSQLRSLFEICLKSNSRPCQMKLHEFDFENLCHQIERSMLREVIFKFGNFTELVLFGCYSHFNVHSVLKY